MIHMQFIVFFTLFLAAALIFSAWIFRRTAQLNRIDRWAFAMLPPAFLCLGALLTHKILTSIYYNLNWIRLQKTFAMAYGYPLYYGPDSGPVLGTMYPPVSILAYLPVTLFSSPFSAMRAAELLNVAYFFLPVLVMLISCRPREQRPLLFPLLAFLLFAFLPFFISSLRSAAFYIHVDAPTLGLAAVACALLTCARNRESLPVLFSSALFAILAVWSKQVAVPLLLALPLYVFLVFGRKTLVRYLLCLAVSGGIISGIFIGVYGFKELYFQLITIPGSQGLIEKEGLPPLVYASYKLLVESSPILLMGCLVVRPLMSLNASKETLSAWFRDNPSLLMLLVSLFMLPTSLLGRAKLGGSSNTLCYTTFFLAVAVMLAFVQASVVPSVKKKLVAIVAIFLLIQIPSLYYKFVYPDHKNLDFVRTAYDYLKKHPGETYFPRLTIMHLLVEKKLYHDSMALMDREMAGYPVSKEQLAAHLPSGFQQIAFLKGKEGDIEWLHLPEFSQITDDPELPGFFVHRRPGKRAQGY